MEETHKEYQCPWQDETYLYLAGDSTSNSASELEQHIGLCEHCREIVANYTRFTATESVEETHLLNAYENESNQAAQAVIKYHSSPIADYLPQSNYFTKWRLPGVIVLILLIVGLGGFTIWHQMSKMKGNDNNFSLLCKNGLGTRATVYRFCNCEYAPFKPVRGDEDRFDAFMVNKGNQVADKAKNDHSVIGRYLLGRALLARGDNAAAVAVLDEAATSSNDSDIFADLGTAYAITGKHLHAQIVFERALAINPNNLVALFNRAVLSQTLGHFDRAREEWQVYLTKDNGSPWAVEARKNLEQIPVTENPR